MKKIIKYFLNIGIGLDQLLNAVGAGDIDETISSRIGKLKRRHKGIIPWSRPIVKIIDMGLEKLDKNHSIDAIEDDEGQNAAWSAK